MATPLQLVAAGLKPMSREGAHRCHRRTGAHTAIQARQPYDVAEQKSACSVIQSQFAIATGEICVKGHG